MTMERKVLLTKRKIEALAAIYELTGPVLTKVWSESSKRIDVFVSHSSSDKDFVRKVNAFLYYSKGGIHAYVDWQDLSLPRETNVTTAVMLKNRIKQSKKVIYVVTNESLKSVWCSWEIGYADCHKGVEDIAILAIKPNNGKWKDNEYLQQYPWIQYEERKDLFTVHMPDGRTPTLREWLDY